MFTLRSRNYDEQGTLIVAEVISEGISPVENVLLQTILQGFMVSISSLRVISGVAGLTWGVQVYITAFGMEASQIGKNTTTPLNCRV